MSISRKILMLVSGIFYLFFLVESIKLVLFFTQLFRGGESGAYKIKSVLFLFAFLGETKT